MKSLDKNSFGIRFYKALVLEPKNQVKVEIFFERDNFQYIKPFIKFFFKNALSGCP